MWIVLCFTNQNNILLHEHLYKSSESWSVSPDDSPNCRQAVNIQACASTDRSENICFTAEMMQKIRYCWIYGGDSKRFCRFTCTINLKRSVFFSAYFNWFLLHVINAGCATSNYCDWSVYLLNITSVDDLNFVLGTEEARCPSLFQ